MYKSQNQQIHHKEYTYDFTYLIFVVIFMGFEGYFAGMILDINRNGGSYALLFAGLCFSVGNALLFLLFFLTEKKEYNGENNKRNRT